MPNPWDKYKQGTPPAAPVEGAPEPQSERPWQKYGAAGAGPQFGFTPPPGFVSKPPDLPPDLPQRAGRLALEALPYAGATIGALAAPELSIPGALGWLASTAIGAGAAGLGAGAGSMAERGIRGIADMPQPESTVGEDILEKGVYPELGGRALTGALSKTLGAYFNSRRLYESALQPTGSPEKAARAVETGIKERIPTLRGASSEIARERVKQLNAQIEGVINGSPADIGAAEYVKNIEGRLDALRKRWGNDATHGKEFVNKVDEFERRFLIDHANPVPIAKTVRTRTAGFTGGPGTKTVVIEPEDMTLAELRRQARPLAAADAQAIKKATYKTIRTAKSGAWEEGTHAGLSIETNQEIASALKDELQNLYPALQGLNKREGALIELEDQLRRFTKREMNQRMLPYFIFPGVGALVGSSGGPMGATFGGAAGAVAGHLVRAALENPAVKSRIAIALDAAMSKPLIRMGAKAVSKSAAPAIRAAELGLQEGNYSPLKERGIQVEIPPVGQ